MYETARLLLKPTSLDDAAFLLKLLNTPKWLQFIGDREVYDLEAAEAYIRKRVLPQYEQLGFGNYTVIRKSDGLKIGSCGLYDREGVEGVDIGFAFLPDFEGQGYAFEAASLVRLLAFEKFGIKRLLAYTVRENFSSQKLLQKLGLQLIGTTNLPNDPEELLCFEEKWED